MKPFNFPRIKKRKLFTVVFGSVGERRYAQDFASRIPNPITRIVVAPATRVAKRFKMQWVRRSHQGWRNRVFGSATAIKIRLQFGRRRSEPTFRR